MAAKTKKELEDEIKILKDEIRKLRSEVKETVAEVSGLTDDAYALEKEGKTYKLVKIVYDLEKGQAAIKEVKDIGQSLAMASHTIKKAVIDRLVKIKGK